MNRLTVFAFLFIGLFQSAITQGIPPSGPVRLGDTPRDSIRDETTVPVPGSDELPDVDEWIFLPQADTSGLRFESLIAKDLFILPANNIKGGFSITVSGETPVKSAAPDAIAAARSNRFSLRMQGHVRDVVLVRISSQLLPSDRAISQQPSPLNDSPRPAFAPVTSALPTKRTGSRCR